MKSKFLKYTFRLLLMALPMLNSSCERDTFQIFDDGETGEPVEVILGFELPMPEQQAVTRGLNDQEEHNIEDVYILVFNAQGERIFGKYYNDIQNKQNYISGEWVSVQPASDSESTPNPDANSSHGYVVATAVKGECYIFGFANVGPKDITVEQAVEEYEAMAVNKNEVEGLVPMHNKLESVKTLNDLYKVQADILSVQRKAQSSTSSILDRTAPTLLYSGAWSYWMRDNKRKRVKYREEGDPYSTYFDYDLEKGSAGKVNIKQIIADYVGNENVVQSNGNINLYNLGMIYLRSLSAHVTFKITYDTDVFRDFKPESWQVVHVPTRAYLMDQGLEGTPKTSAEIEFTESKLQNYMLHNEGSYQFDFYMFENHKDSRGVSDWNEELNSMADVGRFASPDDPTRKVNSYKGVDTNPEGVYDLTEANDIQNYYSSNFGETFNDKVSDTGSKYDLVYKGNDKAFYYAKRELELKNMDSQVLWNRSTDTYKTYDYNSKKFVYVEPKATYVVIKGRLLFNNTDEEGNTKYLPIKNLASAYNDGVLEESNIENIHDGYADVTYTIHLGYTRDADDEEGKNKADDFNVMRNTEYVYNIKITGVNSIYTNVESNAIVNEKKYRVKSLPGADGHLNLAMGTVYNTDAHFNQFNFMLTKAGLSNFYFEIHTPWNEITSEEVVEDIKSGNYKSDPYAGSAYDKYLEKYGENPDFTWFKFRPCWDQSGMFDADEYTDEVSEKAAGIKIWPDVKDEYNKARPTVKYAGDEHDQGLLWNLFTFMETMVALADLQDYLVSYPDDWDKGDVLNGYSFVGSDSKTYSNYPFKSTFKDEKGVLHTGGYRDHDGFHGSDDGSGVAVRFMDPKIQRMFYTVYLDEYYYNTPPRKNGEEVWNSSHKPYWKQFVNKPSRYINFGYRGNSDENSDTHWSLDYESSVMTTQLTIIQPSIQTHYSAEEDVDTKIALGLEHYNETHYPRWTDNNSDIPTGIGVYDDSNNDYHRNGWKIAKTYIVDKNIKWSDYVSDYTFDDIGDYYGSTAYDVGKDGIFRNNVGMNRSSLAVNSIKKNTSGVDKANTNPYLAGAIRMCLNRNRDEDGDGKIDETELKWYLPTSEQLDIAVMCHYSLYDPLFNINDKDIPFMEMEYPTGSGEYVTQQRLPTSLTNTNNESKISGNKLYKYHFAVSDYRILKTEEMMNAPSYDDTGGFSTHPYDMRCVRNLGGESKEINRNFHQHNSITGNAETVPVKTKEDDPSAQPDKVIVFPTESEITGGTKKKVFDLEHLDSRSLRHTQVRVGELSAPHYLYSQTDLPYKGFRVAENLLEYKYRPQAKASDYWTGTKIQLSDVYELPQERIEADPTMNINPCGNYTEDGDDKGLWRAPNAAELAIMLVQLRSLNENTTTGKITEFSTPWFFGSNSNNPQVFSTTSWNFTGPWGRMVGMRWTDASGWRLYLSDAYTDYEHTGTTATQTWYNFTDSNYGISLRDQVGVTIRCVRDVDLDAF